MAGFADTDAFIDAGIDIYDVGSSADADNTARRAKWLQFTQEGVDEIWIAGDWPFTYITGSVTISSGSDSGDLPADFMDFGDVGGIWDDADDRQMEEVRPLAAYGAVVAGEIGNGQGLISQYGNNTSTSRRTLRLPGNASASTTIKILYRKVAPALTDATGASSNLWQLPSAYHNTVLMPLVVSKIRSDRGDARQFWDQYVKGLGLMAARERHRKTSVQRLPSTIRIF